MDSCYNCTIVGWLVASEIFRLWVGNTSGTRNKINTSSPAMSSQARCSLPSAHHVAEEEAPNPAQLTESRCRPAWIDEAVKPSDPRPALHWRSRQPTPGPKSHQNSLFRRFCGSPISYPRNEHRTAVNSGSYGGPSEQ